eukprot:gene45957-57294_t
MTLVSSDIVAVCSTDGLMRVWNLSTGTVSSTLGGVTEDSNGIHMVSIALLPDGRVATGSNNSDSWQYGRLGNEVKIWDLNSGKCLEQHRNHPVRCLTVLPDGRFLTGSSDCTLRVWNVPRVDASSRSNNGQSADDAHTA